MSLPTPGTLYVETRPMSDGDRYVLVEIAAVHGCMAMDIIVHGFCDERGRVTEAFEFGPTTHRVTPGHCDDPRYFAEVRRAARRAA